MVLRGILFSGVSCMGLLFPATSWYTMWLGHPKQGCSAYWASFSLSSVHGVDTAKATLTLRNTRPFTHIPEISQHSSPKVIGLTVRLKCHNVRYDGVADCGRTHLTSISLLHLRRITREACPLFWGIRAYAGVVPPEGGVNPNLHTRGGATVFPATCSVGEAFFKSDAPAGMNLHA